MHTFSALLVHDARDNIHSAGMKGKQNANIFKSYGNSIFAILPPLHVCLTSSSCTSKVRVEHKQVNRAQRIQVGMSALLSKSITHPLLHTREQSPKRTCAPKYNAIQLHIAFSILFPVWSFVERYDACMNKPARLCPRRVW